LSFDSLIVMILAPEFKSPFVLYKRLAREYARKSVAVMRTA
jgi:hypothetical protein